MTTVNISLPDNIYNDAKKLLAKRGYASFSELIRDTLRGVLYPRLTENGFTPEFEEEILKAVKESAGKSKVWRSEKDIDKFFNKIRENASVNDKNRKKRQV